MAIAFEDRVKRLKADDIYDIQTQYDAAMDTEHGSGEHFILIGVLSQKGFRVNSVEEAFEVAGKIIAIWQRLNW